MTKMTIASPLTFWIRTNEPLAVVAEKLQKAGVIGKWNSDAESIFEWFTCAPCRMKLKLNASRKSNWDDDPNWNDPLTFLILSDVEPAADEVVRMIAKAVHSALQTEVQIGKIEQLGDDEIKHIPEETLPA